MKKGKSWAIVALCSFFTQQIFAYSGEIVGTNIENIQQETILETVEVKETQDIVPIVAMEDIIVIQEETHNSSSGSETINEIEVVIESEIETESETILQSGALVQESIIVEELIIDNEENINSSGSLESSNENDLIQNFTFGIKFQNPSYILEKSLIQHEYICDPDKDECKVNIALINEEGDNLSSEFECLIEYSVGFESDNRCNPTTVIFTETTQVDYTVYLENEPDNIVTQSITFIIENSSVENNVDEVPESSESSYEDTVTGTGELLDTGSGETVVIDDNNLPEIILEVQSGLEYSGSGNTYICKKEDCKINLDISDSFSGSFIESDYLCEWDFGSGSFSTDNTDNKCNPGYVNYGTGVHEISARIIDRENEESFTGSNWFIKNLINQNDNVSEASDWPENNEISGTSETLTGSGLTEGNTVILSEILTGSGVTEIFLFPEIYIDIQSGAEYLSDDTLTCNKEDCKINLDVTDIFSEDFLENKYTCKWNFGSGSFSSQDTVNKCNPGYVDYSIGEDIIIFQLFEKDNGENFIEKRINIINKKEIKKVTSRGGSTGGSISKLNKTDYGKITEDKDIIIQSGLENKKCNAKECKINLDYDNSSYESCKWNFGNIQVQDKYKDTCNPGFIYAGVGVHKIQLEIFNNKSNKKYIKELIFTNIYIDLEKNIEPEFNIILQGKSVGYKKYYNNKITCLGVKKCNINLDIQTNTKENISYKWNFGNGEISDSKNPKSVWFSTGSYKINLEIIGEKIHENKELDIQVIGKNIQLEDKSIVEEFKFEEDKENSLFTQFQQVNLHILEGKLIKQSDILNVDNYGKVVNDFKKIGWFQPQNFITKKLKLTRNISQQKKSLKYSGTTFPNSYIYILQGNDIIELQSDNLGKYSEKLVDIKSGDYSLEYYVLDSHGNLFETKKEKLLTLSHEYVENINNLNLISNTSIKKINRSKNIDYKKVSEKIQNIQYASIIPKKSNNTTNGEYAFQGMLMLLSVMGLSILLRRYKIL